MATCMLTCLHAYMRTCLHAYMLLLAYTRLYFYMRTEIVNNYAALTYHHE